MKYLIGLTIFFQLLFVACKQPHSLPSHSNKHYPRQVGDIAFDAQLDDSTFTVCNENTARQYYNFSQYVQYKGEKAAINQYFQQRFVADRKDRKKSGYITIRFIVNCNGQTGRFRVQSIDQDYRLADFSKGTTEQLLQLTKELDGWITGNQDDKVYDYYQYLTFKIENGQLKEIMP